MPLGGCVEEQLEFHEIWVLETNSAGLRRDVLDVLAAEQTPRKCPIVFIASNVKIDLGQANGVCYLLDPIQGRHTRYVRLFIVNRFPLRLVHVNIYCGVQQSFVDGICEFDSCRELFALTVRYSG